MDISVIFIFNSLLFFFLGLKLIDLVVQSVVDAYHCVYYIKCITYIVYDDRHGHFPQPHLASSLFTPNLTKSVVHV